MKRKHGLEPGWYRWRCKIHRGLKVWGKVWAENREDAREQATEIVWQRWRWKVEWIRIRSPKRERSSE